MAYTTITAIRDADPAGAGFPDWTDDQIQEMIDRWSDFIDLHTGQWFDSRSLTLTIDGQGGRILHLPVPVITLTKLQMNESGCDEDLNDVVVYNRRGGSEGLDDRRNPKVAIKNTKTSIYSGVDTSRFFIKGFRNQLLAGTFGFTESDGSTPLRIVRANIKLVLMEIENGGLIPTPAPPGLIVKEVTDGHSITYGSTSGSGVAETSSLTGDSETDLTIADYKAPINVGITVEPVYA